MCGLEKCDPNDVKRPSVSPTDRRLFLAGTLALSLANVKLTEAQAAKGFPSIKQPQMAARSAPIFPRLIQRTRQWLF